MMHCMVSPETHRHGLKLISSVTGSLKKTTLNELGLYDNPGAVLSRRFL